MNDMVQTGGAAGAVAALSNLRKGLQNVKQTLVVKGGDPFLRLLKHGEWVFGQEDASVDDDSLWAVNPLSVQHGFVAWPPDGEGAGSGPLGEVMVPAGADLPDRSELRDVGVDWAQQFSFQLKCVEGGDVGTQVLYKVSSTGGVNAVDKLLSVMIERIDSEDADRPVPIVRLDMDSYNHKKWGKTFVPVFAVAGWGAMDGSYELEDAPAAVKAEPAPAKPKRTRKAAEQKQTTGTAAARVADDEAHSARQQAAAHVPTIEELEAMIAARKAEAEAAAAPKEDPAAARRRELEAQLAALDGGATVAAAQAAPEPGQTIRRRRP